MKATIDKHGVLSVEAETELEAYALSKWAEDVIKDEIECDGRCYLPTNNLVIVSRPKGGLKK